MYVVKRDGRREGVDFNKVTNRIKKLSPSNVDPIVGSQKVCVAINDGITTEQLDNLAAETAISLTTTHLDYGVLAANMAVSNLHKQTSDDFEEKFDALNAAGRINEKTYATFQKFKDDVKKAINYDRDYMFDFFGLKTLMKGYLMKIDDKFVERPQDMFMRVALGIHDDLESLLDTYEHLSMKDFTHATPTLYNAGTSRPQMSSCFLMGVKGDSIDGIYDTLKDCAKISKWAGGIGLHIHNVRSNGSTIHGTSGKSTGIIPMLKVFNATARYVNQGGKRNGSIAIYIQPDHPDIYDFLEMRKNTGDEEYKNRDLFMAL